MLLQPAPPSSSQAGPYGLKALLHSSQTHDLNDMPFLCQKCRLHFPMALDLLRSWHSSVELFAYVPALPCIPGYNSYKVVEETTQNKCKQT